MQQSEMQLLSEIYERYLKTNNRECSVSFQGTTLQEKKETCNSLEYLEECGYIHFTARALGFWQFKITVDGIKFVENDFKDPEFAPIVLGDNSIYIKGSGNTVSDNYNKISIEISQSELPDETKQLIESFLYELKNPHLTPEKKFDKIKSFLSDITSGTVSGVAASGLTVLLSSLLNQIPL